MRGQIVSSNALHTTRPQHDFMEFFDHKDNWGAKTIRVGRPWKKEELRLKSNQELHKLWYVLLKERNMLMTMEEEYTNQKELFPNPERLEKVEDSMENLLDVVCERDIALSELETGETCAPGVRWAHNELGIGYWRKCKPYPFPVHMHKGLRASTALSGSWQHQYMKLRREQLVTKRTRALKYRVYCHNRLAKVFPNAKIEQDFSEFTDCMMARLDKRSKKQ